MAYFETSWQQEKSSGSETTVTEMQKSSQKLSIKQFMKYSRLHKCRLNPLKLQCFIFHLAVYSSICLVLIALPWLWVPIYLFMFLNDHFQTMYLFLPCPPIVTEYSVHTIGRCHNLVTIITYNLCIPPIRFSTSSPINLTGSPSVP